MKHHRLLPSAVLLVASSALMLAQSSPPPSSSQNESAGETVQLPSFTVTSVGADAYRATDALSAARISGSLLDTAETINVITSDFLADVASNSILDATRYLAGVSPGRLSGTNGIADRTLLRGFESSGRTMDNIATSFQGQINPELIERIEVVKGPNSILSPTGSPGGSLNVITKAPKFTEENDFILEWGQYYAGKATIDSTGPVPGVKGLAYRVVASYEDAKTYVPKDQKDWDVNPSFLYKIGDHTQISFKFTHFDWGAHGAAASPTSGLMVGPQAANGVYATPNMLVPGFNQANGGGLFPSWASRDDKVTMETVELTTALARNITMRLAVANNRDDFEENDVYGGSGNTGSNFYDPYTGILTPTESWSLSSGVYVPTYVAWPSASAVGVSPDRAISHFTDTSYQNDYAGNFKAGDVTISPVAGWLYEVRRGSNWEHEVPAITVNLLNGPANSIPNLPSSAYTVVDTDMWQEGKTFQGYGYLKLGFFDDRLLVTGGVAYIKVNNQSIDFTSNGAISTLEGSHNVYSGGALFKVTKNVSAYYSYSMNGAATAAATGVGAMWQNGKQFEQGVKAEFFDQRLGFSVAHFTIYQTNIGTPNPYRYNPVTGLPDPTQPGTLYEDERNNGLEFEINGGLTKDLSVIASYTNMHLRNTLGLRLRNVPDETANIMLDYRFIKDASVSIGVLHTGDTAGETAPTSLTAVGMVKQVSFYIPPHTLTNLGASYTWDRCTLGVNVQNALDTKGFFQASGRSGLQELTPVNVIGSLRIKF